MRNVLLTIFSCIFTYATTSALIIAEFMRPNDLRYKVSLGGTVLFLALIIAAKTMFTRGFQNKMNDLLQELANKATADDKATVNAKIRRHKIVMAIIDNVDATMPLLILMIATSWAGKALTEMTGLIGLIWLSVTIGAIFNIWKRAGAKP